MKIGLLVRVEAKPEFADEVAAMLSAPPVIAQIDLLGAIEALDRGPLAVAGGHVDGGAHEFGDGA